MTYFKYLATHVPLPELAPSSSDSRIPSCWSVVGSTIPACSWVVFFTVTWLAGCRLVVVWPYAWLVVHCTGSESSSYQEQGVTDCVSCWIVMVVQDERKNKGWWTHSPFHSPCLPSANLATVPCYCMNQVCEICEPCQCIMFIFSPAYLVLSMIFWRETSFLFL
jgi:hypothetical protein